MGQNRPVHRAREALAAPLLIATIIVFVDQFTKWLVTRSLGPDAEDHRAAFFGPHMVIQYVENSGAAFGLLRGQTFLLTFVALAVVIALIFSYQRARNPSWQLVWGLGLLLGGALGNLIDRIRLGYVVDYVAISIWPKFNIADSAITLGVLLIAWHAIVHDHIEPNRFSIAQVSSVVPDRDS
jgi:signal peptidase II